MRRPRTGCVDLSHSSSSWLNNTNSRRVHTRPFRGQSHPTMASQTLIPLPSTLATLSKDNRYRQILNHPMGHRTIFSYQIKSSAVHITVLTRTAPQLTTLTIHINSPAVRQALPAPKFIITAAKRAVHTARIRTIIPTPHKVHQIPPTATTPYPLHLHNLDSLAQWVLLRGRLLTSLPISTSSGM